MYIAAHSKFDFFQELRNQGITGELSKFPYPHLYGWYNNIKHYGNYFCDNPQDAEKACEIFTKCGFNYCKINGRCIEIMHDTRIKEYAEENK